MPQKIAITIDEDLVKRIDLLVQQKAFPNRSKAIEEAVEEKLRKIDRGRLVRECNKFDPVYEQALAEEGLSAEADEWANINCVVIVLKNSIAWRDVCFTCLSLSKKRPPGFPEEPCNNQLNLKNYMKHFSVKCSPFS